MSQETTLWPRLEHITLSYDLIARSGELAILDDDAYRALTNLVSVSAAGMVWTYTPPGDGSLPGDDTRLARSAGVTPADWLRLRPELARFFSIKRGRWYLNRDWVRIEERSRPSRPAIPAEMKRAVDLREGKVCTYCGSQTGPFEYDHIFPVVRGGPDAASNLTLACTSCNRSKGAKTLREWRSV